MRVLVCGSREWKDRKFIEAHLDELLKQHPNLSLILGDCRGADSHAFMWACRKDIPCRIFEADWQKNKAAAGPIRNKNMLKRGKPDLVIAFTPDLAASKGTRNMVTIAREAKVEVIVCGEGRAIPQEEEY